MLDGALVVRGSDKHGSGYYGAPRSKSDRNGQKQTYCHNGIDYACYPGTAIRSPVAGMLTKFGHTYSDDLSFRYVEVTDDKGMRHRLFYVQPLIRLVVGDVVDKGAILGFSQELGKRYPGITEHVHYEVKDSDGKYLDPEGV